MIGRGEAAGVEVALSARHPSRAVLRTAAAYAVGRRAADAGDRTISIFDKGINNTSHCFREWGHAHCDARTVIAAMRAASLTMHLVGP